MGESRFQRDLIRKLNQLFPGCVILKNNPDHIQGIPDLVILYEDRWASLEVKKSRHAVSQPNQHHYVELLNNMSYAAFIYPENEEEVLDELQRTLGATRHSRISKSE